MNFQTRNTLALSLLSLTVVGVGACREQARSALVAPSPDLRPATASLLVERASERLPAGAMSEDRAGDSTFIVTLQLSSTTALARVGSVTASIDFDTTRIRFAGDASPLDDVVRAAHVDRGRVRMAAAAAAGIAPAALLRLRFVTRDTSALRLLTLQVSEMHLLDATDMRRVLTIAPPTVVTTGAQRR